MKSWVGRVRMREGMVTSVRLAQPSKAEDPILVMQSGMVMEVIPGESLKALAVISST